MRLLVLLASFVIAAPAYANDLRTQFDAYLSGPGGLAAYKMYFPDQYSASLDRLVVGYDGRGETATATGAAETRRFIQEHAANIAAAPAENLKAYAQAQRDLMVYLRGADVALCAQVFVGPYVYTSTPRPPELLQRLATSNDTIFKAARGGIDNPHPRIYWRLSDELLDTWAVELVRFGLTEQQALMMDDPDLLLNASAEAQCDLGVIVFRSISSLPAEEAAALSAFLLYQLAAS